MLVMRCSKIVVGLIYVRLVILDCTTVQIKEESISLLAVDDAVFEDAHLFMSIAPDEKLNEFWLGCCQPEHYTFVHVNYFAEYCALSLPYQRIARLVVIGNVYCGRMKS